MGELRMFMSVRKKSFFVFLLILRGFFSLLASFLCWLQQKSAYNRSRKVLDEQVKSFLSKFVFLIADVSLVREANNCYF